MNKAFIMVPLDWLEATKRLDRAEAGILYTAMSCYVGGKADQATLIAEESDRVALIWPFAKALLDAVTHKERATKG